MKVIMRHWKRKLCGLASMAAMTIFLLLFNINTPIRTHFSQKGSRLLKSDDSVDAIEYPYNNQTERSNQKVPAVSFDVCKNAHFANPRTYPLIALTGVPGSGNTWTRYLLERASGFYTGSVYLDKKLFGGGFKGEYARYTSGKTIIVKTHDMGSSPTTNLFEGAVLIVRNPYDTLLAYANLVSAGHTGLASHQYFFSSDWDAFVESASIAWEERIVTWVTRTNVMVVYFERLQSHLRQEIVRILQFLHVPIDDHRLDCMVAHPEGNFHRQKVESNRTFDPYTNKHKAIIDMHVKSTSKVLRENGYLDVDLSYSGLSKLV